MAVYGRFWARVAGGGLAVALLWAGACSTADKGERVGNRPLPLKDISLPPGFAIELYADDVPGARSLARGPAGTLFVGTRDQGKVYALVDSNGDHRADRRITLARDLAMPNGVAFRDSALYVAEMHRIVRFDRIEQRLLDPPKPRVLFDKFPTDRWHEWKFIGFGPDGWLYVPVGAPCNACLRPSPYATIGRLRADGTGWEVFAEGVRNSVGFDWHPQSGELWFTDTGRDNLGDQVPPDELNRAAIAGLHFGFPYCHGGDLVDPSWESDRSCAQFVPPAARLGAHVGALGMRFYEGTMFPPAYRGQIIIAEHGSWNSSRKYGYRLTWVSLQGDRAVSYEIFAEGWLQGQQAWGRPVDLLVLPDGSLLVSDDLAGAIYRITYAPPD
ncbi:MAG: sorbosone dehydrogenase family protein [Candidatus Latescibacteria bacterium]|nr:sorbosone dehydrogenase family protein [Candidatus Latescibacterota bacterium]